ncbi:succinylglutamate desuccinylase [Marinomonas mediterranea]|uniref:succinylglutamate desuccinylase n=1 Tax=Marinomonas mediterranea TaxID=119864 RepID=UPI00234A0840|nr:succinylglutamate desuccinylase [Marinomonas mediterranea]WCN14587.1 succinylglutamate desuccinylase [Marinomonas mediterranea]
MMIPDNDFLAHTLKALDNNDRASVDYGSFIVVTEGLGVLRFEPKYQSEASGASVDQSGIERIVVSKTKFQPVSLVISVGIHGNETGPMELVNQIVKDMLNQDLSPSIRLLIIIGNPHAAVKGERFCDVNLNRLFLGAHKNYIGREVKRAIFLEHCVTRFFDEAPANHTRLHYDLHTAIRGSKYKKFAVHPYIGNKRYNLTQFSFIAECGIEAVLLSHQPTTTFSYYSYAEHDAQAFTIELGKVHPFGRNDLSEFEAINVGLRSLIETGALVSSERYVSMKVFKVIDSLVKDSDGYRLNIPDNMENFTPFDKATVLAESDKGRYVIKQTGDSVVFPNVNLPVGQRAGLVIREVKNKDLFS